MRLEEGITDGSRQRTRPITDRTTYDWDRIEGLDLSDEPRGVTTNERSRTGTGPDRRSEGPTPGSSIERKRVRTATIVDSPEV